MRNILTVRQIWNFTFEGNKKLRFYFHVSLNMKQMCHTAIRMNCEIICSLEDFFSLLTWTCHLIPISSWMLIVSIFHNLHFYCLPARQAKNIFFLLLCECAEHSFIGSTLKYIQLRLNSIVALFRTWKIFCRYCLCWIWEN